MSVSPRKRLNAFPEVVIYTKPKSPSKKAAREKAAKEEAEFTGLTRIEQIRLRARRKAEEEDRQRQEAESRPRRRQRTVELEDDDDDDDELDELPELDLKRVTRRSTAIKSSPDQPPGKSYGSEFEGPLSSLTASTDDISSSLSLPHSQNGPSTSQRSRRTTARVEPYIFRPSLDPVSERRQKLKEAKESAAVQANVIKREDFKKSAYEGKSDAIEKVLRDHRREQRKGLDVDGLYRTIELAKDVNELIIRQQEEEEMKGTESEDDSDDDTSVASSSRSDSPLPTPKDDRTLLFQQSLTEEQTEMQKRSLLEENAEEDDSKEGSAMFDILLKDKELANRKRQVGQGVDVGLLERQFWKKERMPMEKVVFPNIASDDALYSMLRDASNSQDVIRLTAILTSYVSVEQINNEEDNHIVSEIAGWLLETAVLTPTCQLSFAALQAIRTITSSHSKTRIEAAQAVSAHLPLVLSRLGANEGMLKNCLGSAVGSKGNQLRKFTAHVRRGERLRAIERLLQAIQWTTETLKQENSASSNQERMQQFLLALHLGIDPQHSEFKIQVERHLENLLETLSLDEAQLDLLYTRLRTLFIDAEAPTTRLAILSILPSTNLHSRSLQRRLAEDVLISEHPSTASINRSDYTALKKIISDKSAAINPLLATKDRDYLQVDANVQLLCYAFTDFALQLIVSRDDPQDIESKPAKTSLSRAIHNYLDYDDESAAFLHLLLPASSGDSKEVALDDFKVNMKQVNAVKKIMESLQKLSSQIHEGKGAFLDRSIVKDQLQRLQLMLQYQLADFGLLAGSERKQESHQGKLSNWFKP